MRFASKSRNITTVIPRRLASSLRWNDGVWLLPFNILVSFSKS